MLKDIVVLPRRAIEEIDTPLAWAMISIATEEGTWPEFDDKNNKGVLRLAFHDSDPNNTHNPHIATEEQLFNSMRANLVLDFVEEKKRDIDMLVVHCEAGVSRSPAIAAVISKVVFGEDKDFFLPPFTPNMHVYRVMLDTAHARLGVI
jgi:predicted protein tyrosine phosphatase